MLRSKRCFWMCLLFLLLVSGCDYVGTQNRFGLAEEDFQLLSDSDPATTYRFTFTGTLTLIDASTGQTVETDLSGHGEIDQPDDELMPDMALTVDMVSRTEARSAEATIEIRMVDGNFYQRTLIPGMPDAGGWQVSSLGELMGASGVTIPSAGESVPDEMLTAVNTAGDFGLHNFTTIQRLPQNSGEENVVFLIESDVKAFLASPTFQEIWLSQIPPDVQQGLSEDALQQLIQQSLDQNFKEFTITVNQTVNPTTRRQVRSETDMNMIMNVPTTDPALLAPGQTPAFQEFQMRLTLTTDYADYGEPLTIEAPEGVIVPAVEVGGIQPTPLPTVIAPPQRPQAEIIAEIEPTVISGSVCSTQSIRQTLNIDLPPLDQGTTQLDLVLLMDNSSSMGPTLETVKATILDMVSAIRDRAPDTRFAVATFADHPNFDGAPGDLPYQILSPFTTSETALKQAVDTATLMDGGRIPESTLFALSETTSLDWRPGALKVIVLFTDATSHDIDPGADQVLDTADDVSPEEVIQQLQAKNIIVVGIRTEDVAATEAFIDFLARGTDGVSILLNDSSQIPNVLIEQVGLLVADKLALTPVQMTFGTTSKEWLVISPNAFDYPREGGTVSVEVEIIPQNATLPDGDYTFQLDLRDENQSYGLVDVNFRYDALCADVYIADHYEDDGSRCSDIGGTVFWDSPSIVVRQQNISPDDSTISDLPVPNQDNYVYVKVNNSGPQPATNVTVALYTSEKVFNAAFANWTLLNDMNLATLEAGTAVWVGPFIWRPGSENISLYAQAATTEDAVLKPNDVACENNVAQSSRIHMVLDTPSYGPNLMAGTLPLTLEGSLLTREGSLVYNTLDLLVELGNLKGTTSFLLLDMDPTTFVDWRDNSSQITGGNVQPSGRVESHPGAKNLLLGRLVGGPDVQADLSLLVAASSLENGIIPMGLQAQDRVVTGATIYYTVDKEVMPDFNSSQSEKALETPDTASLPRMLPIVLTIVFFAAWLLLRLLRK